MGWTRKDPAGVTEWVPGGEPAAYDPPGNYAQHSTLQPRQGQTPTYYGASSAFTNSYNVGVACPACVSAPYCHPMSTTKVPPLYSRSFPSRRSCNRLGPGAAGGWRKGM